MRGNPRDAALQVLLEVEKNQAYSNLLVTKKIKEFGLEGPDRALMTELSYGTLQQKLTLDYYLAPFIKGKVESWVRILLRMAVYQFIYLDRIPNHAVVNEAVTIAKFRGHKGISGMVNGVLRAFLREGAPSLDGIKDPIERLSIETSHPRWMLENWIESFGFDAAAQIAKQNNTAPPQTVRLNTHLISREEAVQHLTEEGFEVRTGLLDESLHLSKRPATSSSLFIDGKMTIQDESSMMPAHALQLEEGMKVLDMCAAPGGKTTHIAQLMNNTGEIVALDIHDHKIKLIDDNAKRLGFTKIQAVSSDARNAFETLEGQQFDRILVDAPCSGYGVIRRKPDMKYTKKQEDGARLATIQFDILEQAYKLIKSGGIIVYSTCTIEPTENQHVIEKFLGEHADMELVALPDMVSEVNQSSNGPGAQVLPYADGDGFYLAALQKK